MKQERDYRKYNVRLTSADWQRGSGRVINTTILSQSIMHASFVITMKSMPVIGLLSWSVMITVKDR